MPKGLSKTAEEKSPCSKCKMDLVVPQEGQARPVVLFKIQIPKTGLDCLKENRFQPTQLSPTSKNETVK